MTPPSAVPPSIADVVDVELLRGAQCPDGAAPDLLAHYPGSRAILTRLDGSTATA